MNGSRPVARVHTGEIGAQVPISRYYLATWNERARTVRDRSHPDDFVVWTLDHSRKTATITTRLFDLINVISVFLNFIISILIMIFTILLLFFFTTSKIKVFFYLNACTHP